MIRTVATNLLRTLLPAVLPIDYRLPRDASTIYLTFDDGPTRHTLRVLELLEKYSVKSTFFILGKRIAENPDVLRAINAAGHTIGNHSFLHDDYRAISQRALAEDLARCNRAIREILPAWRPTLYRPPLGHFTANYVYYTWRQQARVIMWSLDSKDYCASSAKEICDVLRAPKPGDILLFHDEFSVTRAALESLIPRYLDQGLRFASIA